MSHSKKCLKCGEIKVLNLFYKHKSMSDGHLNKCKECSKKDVKSYRLRNINKVRAYDRARGSRQDYVYTKNYRKNNPEEHRAHYAVNNAIRGGDLIKEPCVVCGNRKSEGHHEDYSNPLDVIWLCSVHHKEVHHGQKPT